MLQAAINGTRTIEESRHVPVTTAAIVQEVKACVEAGATAIHFHVRNAEGRESLASEDLHIQLQAIRVAVPGVPLGISTGEWIVPVLEKRLACMKEWEVLPDFVSVNFDEEGYAAVADLALAMNIGVEAGISGPLAAHNLVRSGLMPHCFRLLIEPVEQELEQVLRNITAIEDIIIPQLAPRQAVLLHGVDRACWPVLEMALSKGYQARIGLEDTLYMPGGVEAGSNAEMVAYAQELAHRKKYF